MTLARIWAAFVLIAFLVGGTRLLNGDQKIFVRMITGKSSICIKSFALFH